VQLAADLFNSIEPAGVWVTLHELPAGEEDHRIVSVRLKPVGKKSTTFKTVVSRYSPDSSVLRAFSEFVKGLEGNQEPMSKVDVERWLMSCIELWVEPF
jgi:hypothetical protein